MVPSCNWARQASSLLSARKSLLQGNLSLALTQLNDEAIGYLNNGEQNLVLTVLKKLKELPVKWVKESV